MAYFTRCYNSAAEATSLLSSVASLAITVVSQLILELSNLDFLAGSLRTLLWFIKEHNSAQYFGVVMDSDRNCNFFRRSHRSIPNFHFGTVCATLFPDLKKDIYLFVEILRLKTLSPASQLHLSSVFRRSPAVLLSRRCFIIGTMTLKLDSQERSWLCHKLCEDRL